MPDVLRTVARLQPARDRSEATVGFGADVRASFRMPEAPVLEARDLRFGPLAVMELRYDAANYGASAPMPPQDAMLLSLQLRGSARASRLASFQTCVARSSGLLHARTKRERFGQAMPASNQEGMRGANLRRQYEQRGNIRR